MVIWSILEYKMIRSISFIFFILIHNSVLTDAKVGGGSGRGGGNTGGHAAPSANGHSGSSGYAGSISKGSSTFSGAKGAAAGLAGGLAVGFIAGSLTSAAISSSHYGDTYDGRYYYYGDRYYKQTPGHIRCSVATPKDFPATYNDTKVRITELIYECTHSESCCDEGCCSKKKDIVWIILLVTFILLTLTIIGCCLYVYFRKRQQRRQKQQEQTTEYVYPTNGDPKIEIQPNYGFQVPPYPQPMMPGGVTVNGSAYPQQGYGYGAGMAQPAPPYYPPPAYQ